MEHVADIMAGICLKEKIKKYKCSKTCGKEKGFLRVFFLVVLHINSWSGEPILIACMI